MITHQQRTAIQNLPPAGCAYWTPRRKWAVVMGTKSGALSARVAESMYGLSADEIAAWVSSYEARGIDGLKVGRGLR